MTAGSMPRVPWPWPQRRVTCPKSWGLPQPPPINQRKQRKRHAGGDTARQDEEDDPYRSARITAHEIDDVPLAHPRWPGLAGVYRRHGAVCVGGVMASLDVATL